MTPRRARPCPRSGAPSRATRPRSRAGGGLLPLALLPLALLAFALLPLSTMPLATLPVSPLPLAPASSAWTWVPPDIAHASPVSMPFVQGPYPRRGRPHLVLGMDCRVVLRAREGADVFARRVADEQGTWACAATLTARWHPSRFAREVLR